MSPFFFPLLYPLLALVASALADEPHCLTTGAPGSALPAAAVTVTRISDRVPAAGGAATDLAPGLSYREFTCGVEGHGLRFRELRLQPGQGLELRALSNPEARPDHRCLNGYGGPDFETLFRTPGVSPGFQILGATNGALFDEAPRPVQSGGSRPGFTPNTLIWTSGAGLLAPLRPKPRTVLFVADAQGGHEVGLSAPVPSTAALLEQLHARFPTMTLALQSNMPLTGGALGADGRFSHWSVCPAPGTADWRCESAPRTVLCSRADGTISLLTTSALPVDLANGLRAGGACHAECQHFYNLDGGGSTQLYYTDPSSGPNPSLVTHGHRVETTLPGCSPYRPVDDYLVIGRSR